WTVYSGARHEGLWARLADEMRCIGDVDGDGVLEFALANTFLSPSDELFHSRVALRSYRGDRDRWTFEAAGASREDAHPLVAAGDVDGDGYPDLIALVEGKAIVLGGRDGHRIAQWGGDGGNDPVQRAARVGDIDGDGRAEFVLASSSSHAHVDVVSSK